MSFQAMTWAVNQELKTNEKMVLVMLANRCNSDTGRCDPSHKRLARDCGMSKATLKRCIERLVEAGFLRVNRREMNGVSLPNQYDLILSAGVQTIFPNGWDKPERGDGVTENPPHSQRADRGITVSRGVGSERAEGWGHSELQNSNIKHEVKTGSITITGANKFAPTADGVLAGEVLPEQQQQSGKSEQETAFQQKCRTAWNSYSTAYIDRYGTAPVRNAQINSLVKQLVNRLGEEAAAVADFYVRSVNETFIIRNMHGLGLLVKTAEAYRTQWATGRSMTNTRARQADQSAANYSAADEAKALMRAKRERERGGNAE